MKVTAKADATVLAQWESGLPAIVSHPFGQGQVVFVGTGSGQVWQPRASFEGADELALRLLYWLAGGKEAVAAMLARADDSVRRKR